MTVVQTKEEEGRVYRVEWEGKVLGRIMYTGSQWLAMKQDVKVENTVYRQVKAFKTREEAVAWIER